MNLDDFKNIDFQNTGSLPMAVKLVLLTALFLGLLAGGYYIFWLPATETLDAARAKEQDLRRVYTEKSNQAANLVAYKEQMVEIEKTFGALLKQLPNKSEMDGLLTDINQAGLSRDLEFELFKPGNEAQQEFYAELPIKIKVIGEYHNFGAFSTDISKLSRIVTLNDISVTSGSTKGAKGNAKDAKAASGSGLILEATAKTYRYLDSEELAAKRKAEKDKAGAKKAKKTAEKKG
ncbi:MAG: type 4a pilus biogenesis protein PilO [Methylotenera sp.]|nr:type 4a pilus biogenesis protein PilO [Methylotenera sp.]